MNSPPKSDVLHKICFIRLSICHSKVCTFHLIACFPNGVAVDDTFPGGQSTIVRGSFFFRFFKSHTLQDVLSAALDSGLALSAITIFFTYVRPQARDILRPD